MRVVNLVIFEWPLTCPQREILVYRLSSSLCVPRGQLGCANLLTAFVFLPSSNQEGSNFFRDNMSRNLLLSFSFTPRHPTYLPRVEWKPVSRSILKQQQQQQCGAGCRSTTRCGERRCFKLSHTAT